MKSVIKKETIINLKKTWQYAKKYKKNLIYYIIFSAFLSGISVVIPIITAQVLINLTGGNFKLLIIFSAIVFGVEIFRGAISFFNQKLVQVFFRETKLDLQHAIANETVKLESEVIDKHSSGVFITRLNRDSADVTRVFDDVAFYMTELLGNIGILIAIYIVSDKMFVFFIITMTILYFIEKKRIEKFYEQDRLYREINEKSTGLIAELIRGLKDIKLLNIYDNFISSVFTILRQLNYKRYEMSNVSRKYNFLKDSIRALFTFSFVILGVFLIENEMLTIAGFVVLVMYQGRVYSLLSTITSLLETFEDFNLSAGRVFEIIDSDNYKKETFGKRRVKQLKGNIQFKNVSFAYSDDNYIIKNLNFKIKENEIIGFVGKSGSGKSTIFSLISKLYNIQSGEILLDDININQLDRNALRQNIAVISQNPYIFNFTIRENLKIVKSNLSEKEMIRVCKLAHIHDFIMTLPEKYDTLVGEGGLTLSGGQRQRLAIARALIKKSEIILFDEATSALDNITQAHIQEAIFNLKDKNTIIIIAHRLSTIKNCDRIFLVDDGEIVGEGSHNHLLKTSPIYYNLYQTELISEEESKKEEI